jgi:hypothetical protein
MSASNLDAVNLTDVNLNGLIREDVMSKIWDISKINLPYTDLAGTASHDNTYHSWLVDKLQAQNFDNAVEDGADATGTNDAKVGRRIGNHSQLSTKEVYVSTRADEVDTIGYANELARQITERQQELRRDVEGISLLNQGSVKSAVGVAPLTAGLAAWLTNLDVDGNAVTTGDNVYVGAGWIPGGWDETPGDSLVAAATPGAPEANTETKVRDVVESVYTRGGNPTVAMSTPAVKRGFSEYLFTSSARIASLIADGGGDASQRQGSGSVSVFLTDFGTLKLLDNRLQPSVGADPAVHDNDAMFILDPTLVNISYLQGYRVEPLAKTGLSSKRMMSVDWDSCVSNWDGLGMIPDIDPDLAVTF